MTASKERPARDLGSPFRSPCSFSRSGNGPGFVLPRLKRVIVQPLAFAASTISGPRKRVPPRMRSVFRGGVAAEKAFVPKAAAAAATPTSLTNSRLVVMCAPPDPGNTHPGGRGCASGAPVLQHSLEVAPVLALHLHREVRDVRRGDPARL